MMTKEDVIMAKAFLVLALIFGFCLILLFSGCITEKDDFKKTPAVEPLNIYTNKATYEKGEAVKLKVEIRNTPLYVRGAGVPIVEKEAGGRWITLDSSPGYPCFSELSCERFLAVPMPTQPGCRRLDVNTLTEWSWSQRTGIKSIPVCEWEGQPKVSPHCIMDVNAGPGRYRIVFNYWLDGNCIKEKFYAKSNEFTIKAGLEIDKLCEKKRQSDDMIKSSQACKSSSNGWICYDGEGIKFNYDSRLSEDRQNSPLVEGLADLPVSVTNAVVARYYSTSCNCEKPTIYKIAANSIGNENLTDVECESYYSFLQDYNASCKGCLLEWILH